MLLAPVALADRIALYRYRAVPSGSGATIELWAEYANDECFEVESEADQQEILEAGWEYCFLYRYSVEYGDITEVIWKTQNGIPVTAAEYRKWRP